MKTALLLLPVLLACVGCSQDDAPSEQVAEAAEEIVAPSPEPAPFAAGKWAPRDECGSVEGAAAFRERLAVAVQARDPDALAELAAEDIKLDFGGGEGAAELRSRLDSPDYELWDELDALMTLGCAANEEGGITIPWYFAQDLGEIDPYTAWLVIGEDVPIYAARDGDRRSGALSWDLVEVADWDPEQPRQPVSLADGVSGFIATEKLRSLIDYRLIASSRNGRWRITTLIAGD
jgi:hypothetical protein